MKKKFNLLITGGTGSFGKAVLNRYINNKPMYNLYNNDIEGS